MLEFENTIQIDRPIEVVFAFLADFENVPKWNYFVQEVRKTSAGPVGVGATYHQVRKTDEQDFRVTEYEPYQRLVVETSPQASPKFRRRFTLQGEGSGTLILDEWELDTGKPAIIERLAAGKVRSGVRDNLGKLKQLLETGSVRLQDGREGFCRSCGCARHCCGDPACNVPGTNPKCQAHLRVRGDGSVRAALGGP